MTMRDNVEVLKESIEKSERILRLEKELEFADWLLGNIIRTACQDGYLEISDIGPVDNETP
jgi:hypothetical protein